MKWAGEIQKTSLERRNLEDLLSGLGFTLIDGTAAKVLELLSIENPSGETIYKIYELAEGHSLSRSAFHGQFGVTKDQFNRFKDAVHNSTVTGDWARHAREDALNSDNPMSKGEAIQFVRQLAANWLKYERASYLT